MTPGHRTEQTLPLDDEFERVARPLFEAARAEVAHTPQIRRRRSPVRRGSFVLGVALISGLAWANSGPDPQPSEPALEVVRSGGVFRLTRWKPLAPTITPVESTPWIVHGPPELVASPGVNPETREHLDLGPSEPKRPEFETKVPYVPRAVREHLEARPEISP